MTVTLAIAAAEPQPAQRIAGDRRSLRGSPKDEDVFATLLDETAILGEMVKDGEPTATVELEAEDIGRQDQAPLSLPHFLLATHHAAAAHQAVNPELRPVAVKVDGQEMIAHPQLPDQRPHRSTAKPGRATMVHEELERGSPLSDVPKRDKPDAGSPPPHAAAEVPQPPRQPANTEAEPDTAYKPAIFQSADITETPVKDRNHVGDDAAPEPIEAPAPQVSEKPDVATSQQPSPQQLPVATQLADRLAPAINQAQAILRILESTGDAGPVIKTLQFGLRPRDLGEMRVTLSLGSGELSLRIETQTEEAARRLELDRSLLDTLLTQAGVSVDRTQIDIRAARFDSPQPSASFEGAGPRGGETGSAFAEGQSQRQSRSGHPHQSSEGHQHASSANGGTDHRDRRSIYL